MKHYIRLEKMTCEGSKLAFEFDSSLDLFRKKSFFIEYNRPIEDPRESINAIPFAAVMSPISWALGAELSLPCLDDEYACSLELVNGRAQRWFLKKWSFLSQLSAPRVRNADLLPARTGLLFSGGLDSLTTFARHQASSPELFCVFGADIPLSSDRFIATCRDRFDRFAADQGADICYVMTDIRETVDEKRLKDYSKNWYGEVAHGLILTGLVAPVAYRRVKTLIMASCSHAPGCDYPCGSESQLVRSIRWGGTQVLDDLHELNRAQKVKAYFRGRPDLYAYLRVCWMQFEALNCGRCEKCLRTICELLVNSVDPARCNFRIDRSTLTDLRRRIERSYYTTFRSESVLDFWRAIQGSIDLENTEDLYGSKDFFAWLAGFDRLKQRQNPALRKFVNGVLEARSAGSLGKKWLVRQAAAAARAVAPQPKSAPSA